MGNTFSRFYNPQLVEYLGMMNKYGPKFLDHDTFETVHADMVRTYRRVVARRLISGRGRAYWKFHKQKLERLGYDIGALASPAAPSRNWGASSSIRGRRWRC